MTTVLTLDGASATGKTSVARALARALDFDLLLSGLLYRLVALHSMTIASIARLNRSDFVFDINSAEIELYYKGEACIDKLMQPQIAELASVLAKKPEIRSALLSLQRSFAQGLGLVAEGRDMGSVVFPEAKVKVFLTASSEVRVNRRAKQLQLLGKSINMHELLSSMSVRDSRDKKRADAPLVCPDDALCIDTTNLGVTEVVQVIINSLHVV